MFLAACKKWDDSALFDNEGIPLRDLGVLGVPVEETVCIRYELFLEFDAMRVTCFHVFGLYRMFCCSCIENHGGGCHV